MAPASADGRSLRILHVLRAPLGGLFRHVVDLAVGQTARGHKVGLVTDLRTGGAQAERVLAELSETLELGVLRLPMRRNPHATDALVLARTFMRMRECAANVVHGHGSKGGLYARMTGFIAGAPDCIRAYTPHGGSFNYNPGSILHGVYMTAERVLAQRSDVLLFESAYIGRCFERYVGEVAVQKRVVANGIGPAEFVPVEPRQDAAEFVYVGELRSAKGIDTLLDALALVGRCTGATPRAVLVGSGPDKDVLAQRAAVLGLADQVTFPGPMPARVGFTLGRTLLVPSRAESLPYIVLEAAGARMPMIATNVGGIPEIFGPYADRLIESDDPGKLADCMMRELNRPVDERAERADSLARYVSGRFSLDGMVDAVLTGYSDALRVRAPVRAVATATASS